MRWRVAGLSNKHLDFQILVEIGVQREVGSELPLKIRFKRLVARVRVIAPFDLEGLQLARLAGHLDSDGTVPCRLAVERCDAAKDVPDLIFLIAQSAGIARAVAKDLTTRG